MDQARLASLVNLRTQTSAYMALLEYHHSECFNLVIDDTVAHMEEDLEQKKLAALMRSVRNQAENMLAEIDRLTGVQQ